MKKCPFCAEEIQDAAINCRHCGRKVAAAPGELRSALIFGVVMFGALALIAFNLDAFLDMVDGVPATSSTTAAPASNSAPKAQEETRRELVEKQFSPWDGSHRGLTKVVKESMNDPASYEHVETRYLDKGDHLIVTTTFRGKNAFGGVVMNSVTARVDLNGNVAEVIR